MPITLILRLLNQLKFICRWVVFSQHLVRLLLQVARTWLRLIFKLDEVICFEKIWDNLSTFSASLLRIEDFWNFHHWKFRVANFRATFLNSPAGALGRAGWHMCWPGSAGLRGLIVWLRSSLQIIADKITPAIISENEFPHARHLIWCGASITSIHVLGPRTICEYLTFPFVILKHSDAVMRSLYASYRR